MLKSLTPNLMVVDIRKTVEFYTTILGFTLRMAVPADKSGIASAMTDDVDYIYAQVERDGIEMMFQVKESLREDVSAFQNTEIGASVSFYFQVENIDALFEHLQGKVAIVKNLEMAWYGMREFYIRDCNDYVLGFAEQAS